MKNTVSNIGKILGYICIVLLIFVGIVGTVDMPVAEEGETLTKAQQAIVFLKENIEKFLQALGISASTACLFLLNGSKKLLDGQANDVLVAAEKYVKTAQDAKDNDESKLDAQSVALTALLDAFLLSEVPASVREKLTQAKESLTEVAPQAEKIKEKAQKLDIEAVASAVADKLGAVQQIIQDKETPVVGANTPLDEKEPVAPSYFG